MVNELESDQKKSNQSSWALKDNVSALRWQHRSIVREIYTVKNDIWT